MAMPTIKGALIEAAARAWIGTPFKHQGRVSGENGGVDCAGVIIGVANELKLIGQFRDTKNYSRIPTGDMERQLVKHLDRVSWNERQPGDIVHIAYAKTPQHVGILTAKDTIIHSIDPRGVVETPIGGPMRVHGVFRFREG